MPQVAATELRKGSAVQMEGKIFIVTEFQHVTPGNWRGHVSLRIRDVVEGRSYERKLRSTDRVEMTYIDRKELQYSYADQQTQVFMDSQTYEEHHFSSEAMGEDVKFLVPNIKVVGEFYNEKLVNIVLPSSVEMLITETEPALKGATVTNVLKPAVTETGLRVRVPGFIANGEKIRVDTTNGEYLERAKG
ncbi:MAG TPA: elongation factor P [Planctomycetota bacterium]|nr:elongation factor P [Planctomycetota bacterium]